MHSFALPSKASPWQAHQAKVNTSPTGETGSAFIQDAQSINQSKLTALKQDKTITQIDSAELAQYYSDLKTKVNKELSLHATPSAMDVHEGVIDKIESDDIKVTIKPSEVRLAIIYNSLGISYEQVKKLESKIELYQQAKQDVKSSLKSQQINNEQAQQLEQEIDNKIANLQEQKESLLQSSINKKSADELFNQLRFNGQLVAANKPRQTTDRQS